MGWGLVSEEVPEEVVSEEVASEEVVSEEVTSEEVVEELLEEVLEEVVEEVSEQAYDNFLKGNGQVLGIASYGACVDLLVEYYKNKI